MSEKQPVQKYDLPGGDKVEVHQPFGQEIYFAIADMKGNNYPGEGKKAHNKGRTEYMLMLEGTMELTLNGETRTVTPGEVVIVNDGDDYSIVGEGRSLVFVKDEQGENPGATQVLPIK